MSQQFASGKHSIAFCDRCGRQIPYKELAIQIVAMKATGLLVCDECLDKDHPQWQVGMWPIDDPQALRDPRPDPKTDRGLYGWNPVLGSPMQMSVGIVRVSIT